MPQYLVKLDDGRVWKRHIDQMHRIGDNINIIKTDPIPYHYDISINKNQHNLINNSPDNTQENNNPANKNIQQNIRPTDNNIQVQSYKTTAEIQHKLSQVTKVQQSK